MWDVNHLGEEMSCSLFAEWKEYFAIKNEKEEEMRKEAKKKAKRR